MEGFIERWSGSAKIMLPGFVLFCVYGGYLLYMEHNRGIYFEKARVEVLATCLEENDADYCEPPLAEHHIRCARMAYFDGDEYAARSFDTLFYTECVYGKGDDAR